MLHYWKSTGIKKTNRNFMLSNHDIQMKSEKYELRNVPSRHFTNIQYCIYLLLVPTNELD